MSSIKKRLPYPMLSGNIRILDFHDIRDKPEARATYQQVPEQQTNRSQSNIPTHGKMSCVFQLTSYSLDMLRLKDVPHVTSSHPLCDTNMLAVCSHDSTGTRLVDDRNLVPKGRSVKISHLRYRQNAIALP